MLGLNAVMFLVEGYAGLAQSTALLADALDMFGDATASRWPDVLVGVAIAVLFLRSAFTVLRDTSRGAVGDGHENFMKASGDRGGRIDGSSSHCGRAGLSSPANRGPHNSLKTPLL